MTTRAAMLFAALLVVSSCSGDDAATEAARPDTPTSAADPLSTPSDRRDETATDERPSVESSSASSAATDATTAAASGRCADEVTSGPVTIWHPLGTSETAGLAFDEYVAEFNGAASGITIEASAVELGSEGLFDQLSQTDPSDWPDLVLLQPQATRRLVDSGLVVPPGECGDIEDTMGQLLPIVRGAYTYRSAMQAVPYGVSTPILLFDAAEFRAAGLDPDDPPTTLEELSAASRQIVDSGASPYGLVVYDWYANFLINQGAAQRGDLVAFPANGRDGGPLVVDFATDDNIAAMTWLRQVVADDGGVFIGGINRGLENLLKIVHPTDGGAMTIQTSGSLGDLITVLEGGSFPGVELGVGPMPGPSPGGLVGGNGFWLIDHGDPVRTRRAFEVLKFFVEPERLADYLVQTGYIPATELVASLPAIESAWATHPQLRVGYDQLYGRSAEPEDAGAVYGPNVEIDYAFYRFTNELMASATPVEEALEMLTADVQAELDRYEAVFAP